MSEPEVGKRIEVDKVVLCQAVEDELRERFAGLEIEGLVELEAPWIARYVLGRVLSDPGTVLVGDAA